jgi:GcrA cell cycle regulator
VVPLKSEWTDDRTDLAKRLFADGLSASQIARELGGITRNAVIGKLARMGVTRMLRAPKAAAQPKRIVGHDAGTASAIKAVQRRRMAKEPKIEPTPIVETAPPVDSIPRQQRRTLFDLGERHCRWPCGDPGSPDFFFCGGVRKDPEVLIGRGGVPYCATDCQAAFIPAPKRRTPYVYRGPQI